MTNWTTSNIPSQKGRVAVVTGTAGIGHEVSLELAKAGAKVIIAGRNVRKGKDAISKILNLVPSADVEFEMLDLADLNSVSNFGRRLRAQLSSLDLLINNAAIMNPPTRLESLDGYELQFATNYLGHFALTAELLPLLSKRVGARVVTLSSIAARLGQINFDDLQSELSYKPMKAYSQSKLACLMFAFELQRRSDANRWGLTSVAAHPGLSKTDLNASGRRGLRGIFLKAFFLTFQSAAQGALPVLYAATSSDVSPGFYYGPSGVSELRGCPSPSKSPPAAHDLGAATRLWRESELMTKVMFDLQRTSI